MKVWRIFGADLKDLFIKSESFDKVLEIAREIDANYVGGVIVKCYMF